MSKETLKISHTNKSYAQSQLQLIGIQARYGFAKHSILEIIYGQFNWFIRNCSEVTHLIIPPFLFDLVPINKVDCWKKIHSFLLVSGRLWNGDLFNSQKITTQMIPVNHHCQHLSKSNFQNFRKKLNIIALNIYYISKSFIEIDWFFAELLVKVFWEYLKREISILAFLQAPYILYSKWCKTSPQNW